MGSFPSGVRVSRRAPPGNLGTLSTFANEPKGGFGAGLGGLPSPGVPVFARRKRSVFKGPMGGSPNGFARVSLNSPSSRPLSTSGRRSGEGAVISGIEEEEENEFDDVEEVDHFGPELGAATPVDGAVEEEDEDEEGAVGTDIGSPQSPLVTPLDEHPDIDLPIADGGGGEPLTAEALKKMEEQEEGKLDGADETHLTSPASA